MGYSQGGIHAARIAADPRLAGTYDMQGLVTVGSPTGEIALDPGIEALHLEHDQDVVTGMDGRANPQGAHRTTVTFSGYVDGAEPDERTTTSAHEFTNYRAHVARLDGQSGGQLGEQSGGQPGGPGGAAGLAQDRLAPAQEHLAWLTAGSALTRSVTLERTRPGQPRNPLGAGLGHQFRSPEPMLDGQSRRGPADSGPADSGRAESGRGESGRARSGQGRNG
jgi:hypothetical protein